MKTGDILGNYRLDRLLGEGGMGAVYQAYDLSLQREVAIKIIHPHLARRPGFPERFRQEARVMAHLDHPGIVRVYHLGFEKDLLYLPMEFIKGGNLRQLLDELFSQRKRIPLSEAVLLVRQLCQTVEYAHQKGVLHRDIKPANLMLKPEPTGGLPFRVVLTDLGLAKLLEGLGLTQEGTSMGTPAYMSPEQASGQPTDPRSDVYSLGILLYELAVGRLPFPIRSLAEATRYHTQVPPPAPRSFRPELAEELEQVILKALEKDPGNRYQSAKELESALAALTMYGTTEIASVSTQVGESDGEQESSLITEYERSLVADPPPEEASLETVFDSGSLGPRGASVFGDPSIPASTETLIQVVHKDTSSRTVALPPGTVTIGRDKHNHIVLDDEKASRTHAQITRDGTEYHVTDLSSSNGTFLENERLLPDSPEPWRLDQIVRIGDTWLRLLPATQDSLSASKFSRIVGSSSVYAKSSGGLVDVEADPQHLEVQAGGSVTAQVSLFNKSPIVDHFSISLAGIPGTWIDSLPPSVQLMPGEEKKTAFILQVPRTPESTAGDHPMTLKVTSENDPGQFVEVELILTVAVFSQFASEMQPQRLHAGQISTINISNLGNRSENFIVQLKDPAHELIFQPPQLEIQVPAGESAGKSFKPQLRQRRWIGGQKTHSFTASVRLHKGEPQVIRAEMLSRAWIPAWAPLVVLLLCFSLLGLLGLIGPRLLPTPMPTLTLTATLTPSATPERGVPIVEEWCVYVGNPPPSLANCPTQVSAQPGEYLTIQWRVSNADDVVINLFGNQDLSGSASVLVTQNMTSITLEASNAAKRVQKSVLINVVMPSSTAIPPTAVPPTLVPTTAIPPSPTPTPAETQPPPPVSIRFETFPDGSPVTESRIWLRGDEFLSKGIRLAAAPESSYCSNAIAAIGLPGSDYIPPVGSYFLSAAIPDTVDYCFGVPVAITFVNPVREVSLSFIADIDGKYTMKVYDGRGGLLDTVQADGIYKDISQITFASDGPNISRVTFGREGSITAIIAIVYQP